MNEKAVAHLKFALRRYEERNSEYHLWLSRIYLAMNNVDEARKRIESAFEDATVSRAQTFVPEMHAQKALVLDALKKPSVEVLQEFELSLKAAASQRANLVKLKVMHLDYEYRVFNDLPFMLHLQNLRELHSKVSQDGSSPVTDRVGSLLAASRK
jgi:enamine deaminase RidA (YjgF/YER057c/UK114 family)